MADDSGVRGGRKFSLGQLGDSNGALSLDHPLTPRQTLLTIAAVSFASIVGLLLLVLEGEELVDVSLVPVAELVPLGLVELPWLPGPVLGDTALVLVLLLPVSVLY